MSWRKLNRAGERLRRRRGELELELVRRILVLDGRRGRRRWWKSEAAWDWDERVAKVGRWVWVWKRRRGGKRCA